MPWFLVICVVSTHCCDERSITVLVDDIVGRLELPGGAEGSTTGATSQAGQHRSPGDHHQDGGQHPSWEVPSQTGGHIEGRVVRDVGCHRGTWHEPRAGGHTRCDEWPEP